MTFPPQTNSAPDRFWTDGEVFWRVELALLPAGTGTGSLWDTGRWDFDEWAGNLPEWQVVTNDAFTVNINQPGVERWGTRVRDASAMVTLDNSEGQYNPDFGVEREGFPFFRSTNEAELTGILSDYRADARLQDGFEVNIAGRHGLNTDQGWLFNIAATTADETFALRFQNDRLRFTVRTADGTFTIESTQVFVDGDEFFVLAEYDPTAGEIQLRVNGVVETPVVVTGLLNLAGGATRLAAFNRSRFESADRAFLGEIFGATLVADSVLIAQIDAGDTGFGPGAVSPGSDWLDDAGVEWVVGNNIIIEQIGVAGSLSLRPGRWLRVSVSAGEGYIPVFTGTIDGMEEDYTQAGDMIVTILQCTGFLGLFAVENPPALETPTGGGDRTDVRVGRILDLIGWFDAGRDLQIGAHTMLPSTLARSRSEEMQRAAEAEGGSFFFDGNGVATFKALDWLKNDPRSIAVQMQPGSGILSDPLITSVKSDWQAGRVRNDIQLARDGGSSVRVENTTSQTLYGRRSFQRFDYEAENDDQVLALAEQQLEFRQYDKLSVDEVTLHAETREQAASIVNTLLGDRIRVHVDTNRGWGYTVECWVIGIRYNVSMDDWTATMRLVDTSLNIPSGNPGAYSDGYSNGYLIGAN